MHHLYRDGATGIVDLFNRIDAWRRPERVKPFALCCKCDFTGRKGFETRPFPRYDYFLAIFALCQTVKAKEFVDLGFTGKDISEQMNLKRIALVTDYLKTIPEDELNDKSNETPASIKEESSNYQRKPQNEATHQKGFFKTKIENL